MLAEMLRSLPIGYSPSMFMDKEVLLEFSHEKPERTAINWPKVNRDKQRRRRERAAARRAKQQAESLH